MDLYKKQIPICKDLSDFFQRRALSKVFLGELCQNEDDKKISDQLTKLSNIQQIIEENSRRRGNTDEPFPLPQKQELIGILFDIKDCLKSCYSSKQLNLHSSFYEFLVFVSNSFNSQIFIMELISQIIMYLSLLSFPPEFVHIILNFKFFIFSQNKVIQENFISACCNFLHDDISFDLLYSLEFHSDIFNVIEKCNHLEVISCSFTYLYNFICFVNTKYQTNTVQYNSSITNILLRTLNYIASTNRIEFLSKAFLNLWEIIQNKEMLNFAIENNLIQIINNILLTNNNPELFFATCRFLIDVCPINSIFEDESFYSRYELIIEQHFDEFGPFINTDVVKQCPISEVVKLIGIDILEKLISNYIHKIVQTSNLYNMVMSMATNSSFFLKTSICRFFLTSMTFSSKENRVNLMNNETTELMVGMLYSKNIGIELIVMSSLIVFIRDDPEFWVGFVTNHVVDILNDICNDEESETGVVELAFRLVQLIGNQNEE